MRVHGEHTWHDESPGGDDEGLAVVLDGAVFVAGPFGHAGERVVESDGFELGGN